MTPLDRLIAHAEAAVQRHRAPRVIAVDGPSGAGKTTFADDVAEELSQHTGMRPQIVHMDDVYPGWDGLAEAVGLVSEHVLSPLSHSTDGRFQRWDWYAGKRADWVDVPVADWLVL